VRSSITNPEGDIVDGYKPIMPTPLEDDEGDRLAERVRSLR
jgi:hypothetical protein